MKDCIYCYQGCCIKHGISPNNPTSGEIKQEVLKVGEYKLPSDVESRFDTELGVVYEDCDNPSYGQEQSFDLLELTPDQVKKHFATEQVKQLEWMLGEIGEDEKTGFYSSYELCKCGNKPIDIYCEKCGRKSKIEVRKYETDDDSTRNQLRAELRAKVLSKLQEYKV